MLARRFPSLGRRGVRFLAAGWDTAVWVVDERLAFRFPRREAVVPGLRREMRALPRLAPLLPLPVPVPTHPAAVPGPDFPWPFYGGPLLPGRDLSEAGPDAAGRHGVARALARFLRVLHAPETVAAVRGAVALPADPMGRADMERRVPLARAALEEARSLGLWQAPPAAGHVLDAAARLPPATGHTLVHGDLHFRQLLVDRDGAAAGVLDWIDLCLAPRSTDLQLFWSLLPPSARGHFLATYGALTAEESLRARVLALFLCATLAVYARRMGLTAVEREAVAGLDRTMAE